MYLLPWVGWSNGLPETKQFYLDLPMLQSIGMNKFLGTDRNQMVLDPKPFLLLVPMIFPNQRHT
jgi:hypothetical protein